LPDSAVTRPANALELSGLTKHFGDKTAVDHIAFHVKRGEIYALLGPNGAGKTTSLRMIAGLLAADAGEISIFGVDARADPLAAKQVVAWLPDEPMLYDKLTAWEYLEFIAGLWKVDTATAEKRAEELLRLLGLWDNRNDRCETFSRGMKQKAVLAGALIHEPKLLMLDEPLTGLDAAASRQVKDMLRQKVAEGASVILTTHILEVAERMADRIGIIKSGQILVEGALGELQTKAGAEGQSLEDVFLSLTNGEDQAPAAAAPEPASQS
jgi:ABC-2 type transport system ATP-binding protein